MKTHLIYNVDLATAKKIAARCYEADRQGGFVGRRNVNFHGSVTTTFLRADGLHVTSNWYVASSLTRICEAGGLYEAQCRRVEYALTN